MAGRRVLAPLIKVRILVPQPKNVSEIWPYAIQRAGMSQEEFCGIVGGIWSAYWVKRRGRFVKYPIDIFYTYIDELGYDGDLDNVIFTL